MAMHRLAPRPLSASAVASVYNPSPISHGLSPLTLSRPCCTSSTTQSTSSKRPPRRLRRIYPLAAIPASVRWSTAKVPEIVNWQRGMGAALAVKQVDPDDADEGGGGGVEHRSMSSTSSLHDLGKSLEDPDRSSTSWLTSLPVDLSTTSLADDEAIRLSFDQPRFAISSDAAASSSSLRPTGLFLHPLLTHPEYLRVITDQTLTHGQHIVDRITSVLPSSASLALSPFEYSKTLRLIPKNLDRLSDTLCLVIDMAELVRNVHPGEEWVREADRAYEVLGRFMNELNTNTGLYDALSLCLATPHDPPLSPSELQVSDTFMKDFEKSGIHLPPAQRARFVQLSDEIQVLGRKFLGDVSSHHESGAGDMIEIPDAKETLRLGSHLMDALPKGSLFGASRTSRFVQPNSWASQMILRYAPNARARKLVYEGNNRYDAAKVDVLEEMLARRGELAGVLGKDSWSEVQLSDKMAKTPENVDRFLASLASSHRSSALADLEMLSRLKRAEVPGTPSTIFAWDRDYYTERFQASQAPGARLNPISPFFSVGTVLQGLSRVFDRVYGIRFVPCELRPGEAWHPDVRKLMVIDESEGLIGIVYCDLFSREGKPPNAAHYTVRCSRRIDDDDLRGDGLPEDWDLSKGMTGVEDAEGVRIRGKEGRYQLPLVVLTTDFARPTIEDGPSLLAWQEVETLFHEMGHAMHSMIGRTEYHNVSGTRCATDFVELPSILMESFVSCPDVLPLFARHYATDLPLPVEQFKDHLALQSSLSAIETNNQIMMAQLDQLYHSPLAKSPLDSTALYHALEQRVSVFPPVPGTAWQAQFGHLYGYGATYYSYLFDRAIALKVWDTVFAKSPLDRAGGERFKDEVLKWGGGKDPWELVANVLGEEELAKGDSKAMERVGQWMSK